MPRCYMVKKGNQRHDGAPPPCSPTEASVAPPCYSPKDSSAHIEPSSGEYAVLGSRPACERTAAETEAAHELLLLAQSLPPLPPAAVVTVLEPPPLLPLYTYTIQPTNIYILAEDSPEPPIYHAVQTVAPIQPLEYVEPQYNYVAYQPPPPPIIEFQNEYKHETDLGMRESAPVHVLESVQVHEQVSDLVQVQRSQQESINESESRYESISSAGSEPELEIDESADGSYSASGPEPDPEDDNDLTPRQREKLDKYGCNECGKRYATSSNLSRHKQTHRSLDSVEAKKCGECGKAYVSMPALAMHVLTHRMGHVCGVCGKQFSRPWLLRGHLRSHTGEKPYICGVCRKAFADRSNLRAHFQTHSSDKKYECGRCRKTFALKSYLNKHQESACVRSDDE